MARIKPECKTAAMDEGCVKVSAACVSEMRLNSDKAWRGVLDAFERLVAARLHSPNVDGGFRVDLEGEEVPIG